MAYLRVLLLLACALATSPVQAQTPAPLADPNLDLRASGIVYAMVRLVDGSVIVGGDFTSIYEPTFGISIDRRHLAKFDSAGNLDLAWNPNPDYKVRSLVVDAAGALYAGGNFFTIGGLSRVGVAKLDSAGTGTVDPNWSTTVTPCSSVNACVLALALGPGGVLYVGGEFTAVNFSTRNGLARVSTSTGAVDATWNPDPRLFNSNPGSVRALAVAADGALFVGGFFYTVGGQVRDGLAKLSAAGAGPSDVNWNPSPGATIQALALDSTGNSLFVGGQFFSLGGQTRTSLAKLAVGGTGAADANWNPALVSSSAFESITALAVEAPGSLLVGGTFSQIGGLARRNLARLSETGTGAADAGFDPAPDRPVRAIARLANGDLEVGGSFLRIVGAQSLGQARLTGAGQLTRPRYTQSAATVNTIARTADGSVYVGGYFERANGQQRSALLKLKPDGTLDPDWKPEVLTSPTTLFGDVRVLVADGQGSLYAGGAFVSVGGLARANLAKIAAGGVGVVDAAWNPGANRTVESLALDAANGQLYVGGLFSTVGGLPRNAIARVSTSGTVDPTWDPDADYGELYTPTVGAMVIGGDGHLYVGGGFFSIGGLSVTGLAKLSTSGTGLAVAGWNSGLDGCFANLCVYALVPDGRGALYLGGYFTTVGGQARPKMAKLSIATGQVDVGWNAQVENFSYTFVRGIAVDAGGAPYAGGGYTSIGGLARANIARLSAGTGQADTAWAPGANDWVNALLLASDTSGPLYAGGRFSQVGGTPRSRLAALPSIPAVAVLFADGFE